MPPTAWPEDLQRFAARLRGPLAPHFDPARPVLLTRAPGRLDAFGGISDYTGGTVFEMPLAEATCLAYQRREDRRLVVTSLGLEAEGLQPTVSLELDQLLTADGARDYAACRDELGADPATAWVRYVAGAWPVLVGEGVAGPIDRGATVVIDSRVPLGAGLSSSAAIEIATLLALVTDLQIEVEGSRLARLGQIVENHLVGAPCGLMDQLTVTLGIADHLLGIRCQPDEILGQFPLPAGVRVAAIHTGVKHAVSGSHYTQARVAAFMGHAIILAALRERGSVAADEDPFGGFLARVPLAEFDRVYAPLLPAQISGASFLERYGGTVDTATTVEPTVGYAVAAATRHHVAESDRAPRFLAAVESYARTRDASFLVEAGGHLLDSHASYRDNAGLGAPEADLLLDLAMARAEQAGIVGGRITGGGCGGSVALLGDQRLTAEALQAIAAAYAAGSGCTPRVFLGSSDGALATGAKELPR